MTTGFSYALKHVYTTAIQPPSKLHSCHIVANRRAREKTALPAWLHSCLSMQEQQGKRIGKASIPAGRPRAL
jgi:hypothetical protein